MEEIKQIITFHKEKCFKCQELVEKGIDGTFKCPKCSFEWANLFIKRIPIQPFLAFKELSDLQFCSDYGMAFKYVIENAAGNQMWPMLIGLEERMAKLEGGVEDKAKTIKTVSGKIIELGGKR